MNDRFYPQWNERGAKPRAVDGGIKARSKRGAIAQTWWSGRFIAVLEEMGLGARLERGRRYARTGQVIDMVVAAGLVSAQVQGSRVKPYRVRISLAAYDKAQWARLERALAEKAWYAAQLLSGELPDELEQVFAEAGLPLFPVAGKDMSMDCNCPDWGVPCKHVAAVCYLLAESFDEDPFRILAWRGRERDDLLTNLRALRSSAPRSGGSLPGYLALGDRMDTYFAPTAPIPPYRPAVLTPDAVLRQLPPVGLQVRGVPLVELLRPAYLAMARGATDDTE